MLYAHELTFKVKQRAVRQKSSTNKTKNVRRPHGGCGCLGCRDHRPKERRRAASEVAIDPFLNVFSETLITALGARTLVLVHFRLLHGERIWTP